MSEGSDFSDYGSSIDIDETSSDDPNSSFDNNSTPDPSQKTVEERLLSVLHVITAEGFTPSSFLLALFQSTDKRINKYAIRALDRGKESLSNALTAMVDSRPGVLNTWLVDSIIKIIRCEIAALRSRLAAPTNLYTSDSIMGWSIAELQNLLDRFSPSLFSIILSAMSTTRQAERESERLHKLRERKAHKDAVIRSKSPTEVFEVDAQGNPVVDDVGGDLANREVIETVKGLSLNRHLKSQLAC